MEARNLLDFENVLRVQRHTGLPNEDSFLSSAAAKQADNVSTAYHIEGYKYLLNNPLNWGPGRTLRLGLRVNL